MPNQQQTQRSNTYVRIAKELDISPALFERAKISYESVGAFLNKRFKSATIYPQGSFALGTVVRPVTDRDDYDLDLVCEIPEMMGESARKLKCVVGEELKAYTETYNINNEPEEKNRCWQMVYTDNANFHMDIIPALPELRANISMFVGINESLSSPQYVDAIAITDTNVDEDDNEYDYIGSNPKGYKEWFDNQKLVAYNEAKFTLFENNDTRYDSIEEVPDHVIKTPLQQAIQILKRHRDIMYAEGSGKNKPISIIITTLAARAYNNESNLYDALNNILQYMPNYIEEINGVYYVDNPSYEGENFADKWNTHPERRNEFYIWLRAARVDLLIALTENRTRMDQVDNLKKSLGKGIVERAVLSEAGEVQAANANKEIFISPTGMISTTKGEGSIHNAKSNKHYGTIQKQIIANFCGKSSFRY